MVAPLGRYASPPGVSQILRRFDDMVFVALSGKPFSPPYFGKAAALATPHDRLSIAMHSTCLQQLPEFAGTRKTCAGHPFSLAQVRTPPV